MAVGDKGGSRVLRPNFPTGACCSPSTRRAVATMASTSFVRTDPGWRGSWTFRHARARCRGLEPRASRQSSKWTFPTFPEPAAHEGLELEDEIHQFRLRLPEWYQSGPVDAPSRTPLPSAERPNSLFATLSRPEATGETRWCCCGNRGHRGRSGARARTASRTPMFEQLVDSQGHVLRSSHGPAPVSGLNSGRFATGTKCVGCHLGHSALAVPDNYHTGARFNAAPSARVVASSVAAGTVGARAAVDRRARGPADRVAWVAAGADREAIRLSWQWPIELDSLVLYSPYPTGLEEPTSASGNVKSWAGPIGREVGRPRAAMALSPAGTRFSCAMASWSMRSRSALGTCRPRPPPASGGVG